MLLTARKWSSGLAGHHVRVSFSPRLVPQVRAVLTGVLDTLLLQDAPPGPPAVFVNADLLPLVLSLGEVTPSEGPAPEPGDSRPFQGTVSVGEHVVRVFRSTPRPEDLDSLVVRFRGRTQRVFVAPEEFSLSEREIYQSLRQSGLLAPEAREAALFLDDVPDANAARGTSCTLSP